VLLSNQLKKITLPFLKKENKKKREEEQQFYIFVFTSNRSFLHKSTRFTNKKHHEVFTNASNK